MMLTPLNTHVLSRLKPIPILHTASLAEFSSSKPKNLVTDSFIDTDPVQHKNQLNQKLALC